jgi:dihydrolipoyl dehydrogenase
LLHASEKFAEVEHDFPALGVVVGKPKLDMTALMKHKDDTVASNVNGVAYLFKKNKVDGFIGHGTITAPGKVEVTAEDGSKQQIETKAIVIATGSEVAQLPGVKIDEIDIVSSTGALSLDKVPGKLLVVGAGVIGLELGSVWHRLGADVTVVAFLDRILPGTDDEIAKSFRRILEKQGLKFLLGQKVAKVDKQKNGLKVSIEPAAGGEAQQIDADVVLVAIGRRSFIEGLGLEKAGVALDRGRVVIDDHFATNVPGIYAIGDVVRGPMLAHKAEDEGIAIAEILAGQHGHVNYGAIPSVVYTMPEIATVGSTEEELKAKGVAYKVGKFPFTANGRARAMRATDGFVKILADAVTDRVLGVHIIGAAAGEQIAEAVIAMEFGAAAEDIARTCHAHPTLSEAVKEAAMAVDKRPIHM